MIDTQHACNNGTGAMDYTFAPNKEFTFEEVRLHLNEYATATENFVIQLQSSKGSAFNVKLYSKDMNGVQDIVYQPTKEHDIREEDSLKFTWPNTQSKTWGLEIIWKGAL
ncbi:MAG: hypothetical protein ACETWQ_22510 [Phycisphaerae bacterium]